MISLSLAKQHLEYDDADRDALIQQCIDGAVAMIEGYIDQPLERRSVNLNLGTTPPFDIRVGDAPDLQALTFIDGEGVVQTVSDTAYRVVKGHLYSTSAWPSAPYGFTAAIEAGFNPTPPDLVSAALVMIGHLFANREAVVTGTIATELPLGVKALCQPYIRVLV